MAHARLRGPACAIDLLKQRGLLSTERQKSKRPSPSIGIDHDHCSSRSINIMRNGVSQGAAVVSASQVDVEGGQSFSGREI